MTGRTYVLHGHRDNHRASTPTQQRPASVASQTCLAAAPLADCERRAAAGLSKSQNRTDGQAHISKQRRVTVFHGAGLIMLESRKMLDFIDDPEVNRSKRGKITSWSAKSRMHCRRLLHSLTRDALKIAWFVTATYPAVFPAPDDHDIYKSHLHRLNQEIRRRHPEVSGVWKLEFQKREAAHFHFLLIGCTEDICSFRAWIAKTWARIVNSGDPNHEAAGTGVDRIRKYGGVMAYVTSYISKGDQTLPGNFTGRYWGIINRKELPVAETSEYTISDRAAVRINRWFRTLSRKYQEQSRWKAWAKIRNKLPGDYHWMSPLEFAWVWSQRNTRPDPHHFELVLANRSIWMMWDALLPTMTNGSKLRPPRRVRQRNNSGGSLLCNASACWSAVERGLERGIL